MAFLLAVKLVHMVASCGIVLLLGAYNFDTVEQINSLSAEMQSGPQHQTGPYKKYIHTDQPLQMQA